MSDQDQDRDQDQKLQELAELTEANRAILAEQSKALLKQLLDNADLPTAATNRVRAQFADSQVLDTEAVHNAIQEERDYLASLREDESIQDLGQRDDDESQPVHIAGETLTATPTSNPLDRIELGLRKWFGGPLPSEVDQAQVPHIDISELYATLTGDVNISGAWDIPGAIERTGLANITESTFGDVITDSMNVVIVDRWQDLAAEGYEWWKKVVHEQDFDSLYNVEWVTYGGFGNLDKVNFGQTIPELSISDLDTSEDTGDWELAANMISVPLDVFDKAAKRGALRSLPKALSTAAIRTLSADVSNIFTSNAGVGPTLDDSNALFHASHNNLDTTALSFNAWTAVIQDQWKQTEQESGARLAIRPWGLLVPIELEGLGVQILANNAEHDSADRNINPYQYARERVIVPPEFTDTNNWATFTNPKIYPSIGVGYRFGRKPQLVAEPGGEQSQGMFTSNVMRWKVQWVYVVSVISHRGLQKRNV